MERTLFSLAKKVLGLEHLGMDGNFFHLGGDSVLAMELSRIAAEDAAVDLHAQDIFRSPILSQLASKMVPREGSELEIAPFSLLEGDRGTEERVRVLAQKVCALPSLEAVEDAYPSTPLQESMIIASLSSPGHPRYIIRHTFRLSHEVDSRRLWQAWRLVILANPVLRTRFVQSEDTHSLIQVVTTEEMTWDVYENLETAVTESSKPAQLGDPLLRLSLVNQSAGCRYLIVIIHHAACDGWSLGQTLRQVEAAYYGQEPSSSPFKNFISYLRNSDEHRAAQFWGEELGDFAGTHFPTATSTHKKGSFNEKRIKMMKRTVDNAHVHRGAEMHQLMVSTRY
ncbi:hypothetical protein N3K66_001625 [Trichothecium roseum]|uniref:Uncharacterized protein n=1 Tax=Trichothecium roseum TaxID=47278 RepID=A0ACC0VF58_9HYPO|nr:hypothetical protein N3K66_001625 [Trichothecium roseum]